LSQHGAVNAGGTKPVRRKDVGGGEALGVVTKKWLKKPAVF
jgi:hypothetical protein